MILAPGGLWCYFKSYPIPLLMKAGLSIDDVPFASVSFILYKHQTDLFLVQISNFIFQLSRKIIAALMTLLLYTLKMCMDAVGKMLLRINVYNFHLVMLHVQAYRTLFSDKISLPFCITSINRYNYYQ